MMTATTRTRKMGMVKGIVKGDDHERDGDDGDSDGDGDGAVMGDDATYLGDEDLRWRALCGRMMGDWCCP